MTKIFKTLDKYNAKANTKINKIEFLNGVLTYGKRIIGAFSGSNTAQQTLYTVAPGKILFIISSHASIVRTAAGVDAVSIYINDTQNIFLRLKTNDSSSNSNAQTYTIPLIVNGGESVIAGVTATNTSWTAGIVGYEVDAVLLPLFLS